MLIHYYFYFSFSFWIAGWFKHNIFPYLLCFINIKWEFMISEWSDGWTLFVGENCIIQQRLASIQDSIRDQIVLFKNIS